MKKTALYAQCAITFIVLSAAPVAHSAITLTDFSAGVGSDGISYDPLTRIWSGTQVLGNLFNESAGSWDLSGEAPSANLLQAAINVTVNSTTAGYFNVTLEDDNGKFIGADFNWDQFSLNSPTLVTATFGGPDLLEFNLLNVKYWNVNSSGASGLSVNATFNQLSVIPEPTSSTLVLFGAIGVMALRRLRKV